jgi:hypothetical protein
MTGATRQRGRLVLVPAIGYQSFGRHFRNALGPSHRPSAFTAVLARRQFDGSGAAGLIESSAGGQSFPISRQPSFLHRCIGPESGIGGITFCRAPPYEPCLRVQRDRERGWRDRGRCEHDAPLSRDARSRGV